MKVENNNFPVLSTPKRNLPNLEDVPQSSDFFEPVGDMAIAALPLAGGLYAGLSGGPFAALSGAAVSAPAGVVVGALAAGFTAERLGGSGQDMASAALWGGMAGGAVGLVGGGILGASAASPWSAACLGVLGAITAGLVLVNRLE